MPFIAASDSSFQLFWPPRQIALEIAFWRSSSRLPTPARQCNSRRRSDKAANERDQQPTPVAKQSVSLPGTAGKGPCGPPSAAVMGGGSLRACHDSQPPGLPPVRSMQIRTWNLIWRRSDDGQSAKQQQHEYQHEKMPTLRSRRNRRSGWRLALGSGRMRHRGPRNMVAEMMPTPGAGLPPTHANCSIPAPNVLSAQSDPWKLTPSLGLVRLA